MDRDTSILPFVLPRPILLCGEVTHGKALGHTLGFPTANISLDEGADIRRGIYASRVELDGTSYIAVSNVGTRPTVDGEGVNCETHVIDFEGDLYGKSIQVTLLAYLREEKKFASVEALSLTIREDVRRARAYFYGSL